ncbi:MAG: TlpA family protein disulfide reductase [Rhodoferax sp.]|nr:TlpA family protein disulfide reductase [Rhodoferax sp.]MCW5631045.1 TlpA family protein disulfide reductase [Rhodoferax sp.]MCW5642682.1 TlpA family protein disulfide reductase [Rhodoferax sp.]
MKRRTCLLAGVGSALSLPAWAGPAAVGERVDWPRLQLLDGSVLEAADWSGQPALVVLWATYCPFCKRHNAHLDKLYEQTRAQGLRILAVAQDTDERLVRQYMVNNAYRFPVAMDGGQVRSRLTSRRVIPMTCAIDRQGRLVQAIPGEMFEEDLVDLARGLIQRAA